MTAISEALDRHNGRKGLEGFINRRVPSDRSALRGDHGRPAVALVAIIALALNLRAIISAVPPLLERISAPLGISHTVAGLLGSLPTLAFSAAAIAAPIVLRRTSAEKLAVLSLAMAAVGQIVRPWSGGPIGYIAATVVALIGAGLGNVALSALVKAWFPRHIGAVTAVYATVMAVATAVPALVVVPLADVAPGGWRVALACWGLLAAVCAVPCVLVLRTPRALPAHDARTAGRLALHRSRTAWGMSLVFGMTALGIYSLIAWLPVILRDAGMDEGAAGDYLALYLAVGAPASVVVPLLASRTRRHPTMIVVCGLFTAVGLAGLAFAPTHLTWVWAASAGLGGAVFPLSLTLFGLRSRSASVAGQLSGFTQARGYAVAATGPLLVGILHQASGGWLVPFALLGTAVVLLFVGAALLAGAGYVEDDLEN